MSDPRIEKSINRMKALANYYRAMQRRATCQIDKRHWASKASEIEYCIQIVREEFAKIPADLIAPRTHPFKADKDDGPRDRGAI